ncbi:MAG: AbrB/MazE/SpoVT family DNA-binding domain-containing protein [Elusimicrobiota bacterium]
MFTTIVTTKGQIVIPAKLRRRFNIKKGIKLFLEEQEDSLVLRPATPEYFNKLAGVLPTKGKLSKSLLEERSKDKAREA